MEWEGKAVDEFVKMPLSDLAKAMAKVFAEKIARRNKSDKVTMKEIDETKKVYFATVPEEARRKEWEKRIKEGEADLMERMEKEARTILDSDIELYDVELCHAQYFRCGSQVAEIRELKNDIAKKVKELKMTEWVADNLPDDERILPHHRLTFSISACPNSCTGTESREFGIHGTAKPVVTDIECSKCESCIKKCPDNAVLLIKGKPEIDYEKCRICEACVKVCPTGTLESAEKGYRIMVGGSFGRHSKHGYEIFKITDKKTILDTIDACVNLVKEEAIGEESITTVLTRTGVAPIYKKLYAN